MLRYSSKPALAAQKARINMKERGRAKLYWRVESSSESRSDFTQCGVDRSFSCWCKSQLDSEQPGQKPRRVQVRLLPPTTSPAPRARQINHRKV